MFELNEYFNKKKRSLLPKIKDWTASQDDMRYSNNVKDMTWNEWFYLHTSAYNLIYYGINACGMAIFIIVAAYFKIIAAPIYITGLSLVFAFSFLINLISKIKNRDLIKNLNFYDVLMRE